MTADAFSQRSDLPISRLPSKASPEPSQAISNNVLPGYSDTFGPPNWVSSPSISAIIANMTITTPTAEEMHEADRLEEMVLGKALAHITAIKHNSDVEAITWEKLEAACLASPVYQLLHRTIQGGVSDNSKDWDIQLQEFFIL